MKNIMLSIILCLGICCGFAQYSMDDQIYDYIDAYKDLAMQEMELYKVPASITLAQAIYSSKAGSNKVAKEANNHFGIMCHTSEWTGETFYETDNRSSDYCYRKYKSVAESYRDHSLFISQRSRYVKLFYFPITDYKSWANGLKEAGYSANPRYADTLISIIEKYYLMHYDRKVAQKMGDTEALQSVAEPKPERITETPSAPATKPVAVSEPEKAVQEPVSVPTPQPVVETKPAPAPEPKKDETPVTPPAKAEPQPTEAAVPAPEKVNGRNVFILDPYAVPFKEAYYPYTSRPVYENNKTKFIIAKAGDTYQKLATSMQMSEKNLRLYNDVYDESEPIEDEVIYLEMKSTKSPVEHHKLAEGDTYRYIAQRYGVQLKIIIKRNSGSLSNYAIGDSICIGCK
ncbi:MAG: glucosaminidase domain-containing protein [Bacteroidales bacterium]|nr:glucosaminidase domain-containing protein [Bacteroidales bacterium]